MAVQAQYPSNVLLLNSKIGEEAHDYSLQPQPGGILDQSRMLFNNGGAGTDSRKRGRETAPNAVNQFRLQSQAPQLIDLTQLHNHHRQNVVSTGLRLSFASDQHQQQQRLHLQQQQQQQQQGFHSSTLLSLLSEGLSSQIKQHRDEIDQLLHAQGEELQRALTEKRQRQYRALLRAAEETVARRLREKEAEVERATRRNTELEARAAQLTAEAQAWQAKAKAQEATVASLRAHLQHAIMTGAVAEDGGVVSCAAGVEGKADDAESAYVDPERAAAGPRCRGCEKRVATVVVLPCRHLCVCGECERHFRACPVCLTVKNSTVEVFLS